MAKGMLEALLVREWEVTIPLHAKTPLTAHERSVGNWTDP